MCVCVCVCVCVRGDTYYVSVGRECHQKESNFQSVWDGDIPLYKFWEWAHIYLSGKGLFS